jgi:hypothetical protein
MKTLGYIHILFSNKKNYCYRQQYVLNPKNIILSKTDLTQREHNIWFYLYEVLEQANLTYGGIQNGSC